MEEQSKASAAPPAPAGDQSPVTRQELDAGLRFAHRMEMQTRLAVERVEATLTALLEALHAGGRITREELEAHMEAARKNARARSLGEAHVQVGMPEDKYAMTDLPDVDCRALIPICQGRCCRLRFALTFQDLDEGVVRWDYGKPYQIRQRPEDGHCVHAHPEQRLCTVYEHRPGICRQYDCRKDARIWLDFENKIPAPMEALRDQPVLVERIGIKRP